MISEKNIAIFEHYISNTLFLYREVPKLKQRIAGKSIPIEKFAVNKAKRYLDQDCYLTLPALVCIYSYIPFT